MPIAVFDIEHKLLDGNHTRGIHPSIENPFLDDDEADIPIDRSCISMVQALETQQRKRAIAGCEVVVIGNESAFEGKKIAPALFQR